MSTGGSSLLLRSLSDPTDVGNSPRQVRISIQVCYRTPYVCWVRPETVWTV